MKKLLSMLISKFMLLPATSAASSETIRPLIPYPRCGTYNGSINAAIPIPIHTYWGITYLAWTLDIKMNYTAHYDLTTGKIRGVKYMGAEFYPDKRLSPDGHVYAVSIDNDSAEIKISLDGDSITFTPRCTISFVYYNNLDSEIYTNPFTTPLLTGLTVIEFPNKNFTTERCEK